MRKLQVAEIDFLFRVGFLLDSSVCDKYFGILIEHFCDNVGRAPRGARGLKSRDIRIMSKNSLSRSSRSAWIEI